ncbi:MAG TPA: hypothetical protein VGI16_16395 [Candidatus Acidoferrum sp.]|jgi:hypothetical protein
MKTAYHIFKEDGERPMWLEVAQDLVMARDRVRELAENTPAEYFIYCPQTATIMEVSQDSIRKH